MVTRSKRKSRVDDEISDDGTKRPRTNTTETVSSSPTKTETSSPTEKEISSAIFSIIQNDKNNRDDMEEALSKLLDWACIHTDEKEVSRIRNVIINNDGVVNLLDLIKNFRNIDGGDMMAMDAIHIFGQLFYGGGQNKFDESAVHVMEKFIEYGNGIDLILTFLTYVMGEETFSREVKLKMTRNIWGCLGNMLQNCTDLNSLLDADTLTSVLDSVILTLNTFGHPNEEDDTDIFFHMILTVMSTFHKTFIESGMFDYKVLQAKNIFQLFISAMKHSNGSSWFYEKYTWGFVSQFFYSCCKDNQKMLSKKQDFELVIPFCILFIEKDVTHASKNKSIHVLRKASRIVGKKNMLAAEGMMKSLGTATDASTTIDEEGKFEAGELIKFLWK